MRSVIRIIALLLCAMMLASAVACTAEKDKTTTDDNITYAPSEDTTTQIPITDEVTAEGTRDTTAQESDSTVAETIPSVTDTEATTDTQTATDSTEITVPADTETAVETDTEDKTTTAPITTAPVTTAPVTTAPVTTAPETEPPETEPTKERTDKPVIQGVYYCANDRAIIYGTCESDSTLTIWGNGVGMRTEKSAGKYFYIEQPVTQKGTVYIAATAPGKVEGSHASVAVQPASNVNTAVFGAKNSRLMYQPTLPLLLGQVAADQNMLNYAKSYLTDLRAQICKATGKDTKIIYVICPNPGTVYSDQMPEYVTMYTGGQKKLTPAWQFVNTMKNVEGFVVPDLYMMYDRYKDQDIFYRTDTHWSELGAYYACEELMRLVRKDFPGMPVYSLSSFKVVHEDHSAGDMAPMIGAGGMREEKPILYPNFYDVGDYYLAHRNGGFGAFPADGNLNASSDRPSCYFMSDSYGANFLPFAGMYFGKMYSNRNGVMWTYNLDFNLLAEKKPDYLMYVYTDRNIDGALGQIFVK